MSESLFGITSEILVCGGFLPDPGPRCEVPIHTMLPDPRGFQVHWPPVSNNKSSSSLSENHSYQTGLQIPMQITLLRPEVATLPKDPIQEALVCI